MIKYILLIFLVLSPFLLADEEKQTHNVYLPLEGKVENNAFTIVSSDEYSLELKFSIAQHLKEIVIGLSGKSILILKFDEKEGSLPKLSSLLQLDEILGINKVKRVSEKVVFVCAGMSIEKCIAFRIVDLAEDFHFTLIFSEIGHLLHYNIRDGRKKKYASYMSLTVKKNEDYLVIISKPNFRLLKIPANKRSQIIELDNTSSEYILFKSFLDLAFENSKLQKDEKNKDKKREEEISASMYKLIKEVSLIHRWDGFSYFRRPEINK